MENVVIIGSGPAGLTAALYTARAGLSPQVISGAIPGGQLMITSEMENFPGFPEGIQGPELIALLRAQAEKFEAKFIDKDVTALELNGTIKKIWLDEELIEARAVIIATGATARWLGLDSETRLRGRGVSACATCDGFFFREKHVLVIGGGDTALEEATYLTRFASKVSLVHRRDQLRGSKAMADKALGNPKIEMLWNSVLEEVLGEHSVTGAKLKDVVTGKVRDISCDGVFVAIGHEPNTRLFKGQIDLDEDGYILITQNTQTSLPGVFASGDVADSRYQQAITAAGTGCMSAIDAQRWLESQD